MLANNTLLDPMMCQRLLNLDHELHSRCLNALIFIVIEQIHQDGNIKQAMMIHDLFEKWHTFEFLLFLKT